MEKKLLSIFICTLLIVTIAAIPISSTHLEKTGETEKNIILTGGFESVPILDFVDPPVFNLGSIPLELVNTGMGTAEYITWEMRILEGDGLFGGRLFSPKEINGTFPSLGPDQSDSADLKIRGFSIATVYFGCKFKIKDLYGCIVDFEVKQEWTVLGLWSLHLFLPSFQPVKEWMNIENYSYFNETDQAGVELMYGDIRQYHNVRVAAGSDSRYPEILFKASCKFNDGIGILEECGITREIVESGEAHWEVELVNKE